MFLNPIKVIVKVWSFISYIFAHRVHISQSRKIAARKMLAIILDMHNEIFPDKIHSSYISAHLVIIIQLEKHQYRLNLVLHRKLKNRTPNYTSPWKR